MTYKFICPKCNKQTNIIMKMSEYTNKGYLCECGTELIRDISDMSCTFDASKITGFCGKCGN